MAKSRNLFGTYEQFAQVNPGLNWVMYFLMWFTVPVEVFFRRNLGQRWFTTVNFYIGLLVLAVFAGMQRTGSLFGRSQNPFSAYPGFGQYGEPPVEETPSFLERLESHSMSVILVAYVVLSIYHFIIIWWRNRTFTAVHSLSNGDSRFEGIAYFLLRLINLAMVPIVAAIVRMLPEHEKQNMVSDELPPAFMDAERFADTIIEPLVLLILGLFASGSMSAWLIVSGLAIAVSASFKHTARLNKLLDMRDSSLEAEDAQMIKKWLERPEQVQKPPVSSQQIALMEQIKEITQRTPEVATAMENDYPDLMDIIESVNAGSAPPPKEPVREREEEKKPAAMPLRQSDPVFETKAIFEEPPPPPVAPDPPPVFIPKAEQPPVVPPPVYTPQAEPPPVSRERPPVQNWEPQRPGTPAESSKRLMLLLIVAGLVIVGLVITFVLIPRLKKSDTSAKEPENTEVSPKPSKPVIPTAPAPTSKKGEIQTENGGIVNMRDQPSEDGKIVLPIPTGAEVAVLRYGEETQLKDGEKGRWCRVAYRAELGWVWGKFVKEKQ